MNASRLLTHTLLLGCLSGALLSAACGSNASGDNMNPGDCTGPSYRAEVPPQPAQLEPVPNHLSPSKAPAMPAPNQLSTPAELTLTDLTITPTDSSIDATNGENPVALTATDLPIDGSISPPLQFPSAATISVAGGDLYADDVWVQYWTPRTHATTAYATFRFTSLPPCGGDMELSLRNASGVQVTDGLRFGSEGVTKTFWYRNARHPEDGRLPAGTYYFNARLSGYCAGTHSWAGVLSW